MGLRFIAAQVTEGRMGLRGIGSHSLSVRHPGRLDHEQELSLHYGDLPGRPAFASDEARREAWLYHRDRLLAEYRHGRRPLAWWAYGSSLPWPGLDHERSALYAAGVLAEEERRELEVGWRREFEKAQASDFWLALGPGRFLKGAPARRAHYRWADVPLELVKEWTTQRRRQSRTIRRRSVMTTIRTAAVTLLALGSLSAIDVRPSAAEIYRPWCVVYQGSRDGATSCAFTSFAQCMMTGGPGTGGSCVQNPWYLAYGERGAAVATTGQGGRVRRR
jgi:hypothetical protein